MKKLYLVRTIILAGSLLLQLNTLCFQSRGAAGDVDLSFDPGSGVNGPVRIVVAQPDGKVIIVGEFTTVKGLARSGIARLNADGSGDATFNAGTNTNISGYLRSVAPQSDGKVLIGGSRIARLNANGSLDGSFTADIEANGHDFEVQSLVVQSDGKVLIGGSFSTVNGANRNGIARLNANGSLDSSFDPGTGVGTPGLVASIVVQSDGKVLIGGSFGTVNGTNRYSIARLNANGSLDSSFNSGTAAAGGVSSVGVQPDGKVLFGGYGIARLKSDGSPDTNFISPSILDYEGDNGWLDSVAVQSDGKVLIAGYFAFVNGTNRDGIARLNANGSLDSSFNLGAVGGYANEVSSIAVQSDGNVLIGGYFPGQIARVNTDGSFDGTFRPSSAALGTVFSLVVQSDGKVLVGEAGFSGYYPLYPQYGAFTFVNGTNRYGSARLNADGGLDSTFISNTNFNPNLAAFIDPTYCNSGCAGACYQAALPTVFLVQSDGKVLIGGYVETTEQGVDCLDQTYQPFFARFNADGSRDTSFSPNPGTVGFSLALQPDGKIVVGNGPFRLNADGSLDSSFNSGTGANGGVSSVVVQADGKVLIGGSFTAVNGTNRNNIARLNSNGSVDGSFNPGTGVSGGFVSSIALQSDGKVLIGGLFTTVNGTNRNHIARLNANGSLDSSFNPGTGADGWVRSIALQPDGNVLIGGDFTFVNGAVRPHVARLYGDSVAPSLNIARSNAFAIVSWPVTGLNFHLQESTNLSLPNSWSPVAQPAVTNAGQISVTVPTTVGRKFFRLKSP